RYHPGPAVKLLRQVSHVEGAVFLVNIHEADGDAALLQRPPRRDVGVVIEVSEQNFVARPEFAAEGAAEGEGQSGHVGTEDHLIRVAGKEIRHGGAGAGNDSVGAAAGGIGAAGVGV